MIERWKIDITGIVQGVGFRPFIYRLANEYQITGWVCNNEKGVQIEAEGERENLYLLKEAIIHKAPTLAWIETCIVSKVMPKREANFCIQKSQKGKQQESLISPDIGMCEACQKDIETKGNTRYLYPFTNCTYCGPRFTIVKETPYDRKKTSMHSFQMCKECQDEYLSPSNRRFHAQPIACNKCGPQVELWNNKKEKIIVQQPIEQTKILLKQGKIIAIKGLGGYHLACLATNIGAIKGLRERKKRDKKPFALMIRDIDIVKKYCIVEEAEKKCLLSKEKPIVLLKKKRSSLLYQVIAPDTNLLGVMLAYTPLHYLLFDKEIEVLVMTSGNLSDEPIIYQNEEAIKHLGSVADYFLIHNRDIYTGIDDSVVKMIDKKEQLIRRARGYVPLPFDLSFLWKEREKEAPSILACGGELKNTFCISRDTKVFMSQHLGDLKSLETLVRYKELTTHFKNLLQVVPTVIAYDTHPDCLISKEARKRKDSIQIPVQHHHAHIASCCAENQVEGLVIGIVFDGTGWGEDDSIWGGEFFVGDYRGFQRVGSLQYVKLLGNEKAIQEPWRMALSYLFHLEEKKGDCIKKWQQKLLQETGHTKEELQLLRWQWEEEIHTLLTSSMGRLFDGVAALLGIRQIIDYEAQAAIELEQLVKKETNRCYSYQLQELNEHFISISIMNMIQEILLDREKGVTKEEIGAAFHQTIIAFTVDMCKRLSKQYGIEQVVLSGGVFQNSILQLGCKKYLEKENLKVYTHQKVPTNDGGIALGQMAIALAAMME